MKALITGISGFAGSHLAEFLLNEQVEVFGLITELVYFTDDFKISKITKHFPITDEIF